MLSPSYWPEPHGGTVLLSIRPHNATCSWEQPHSPQGRTLSAEGPPCPLGLVLARGAEAHEQNHLGVQSPLAHVSLPGGALPGGPATLQFQEVRMQPRAPLPGLPSSPWSQEGGQTLWHKSNGRESPLLRQTPPSSCSVSDAVLMPAHRA